MSQRRLADEANHVQGGGGEREMAIKGKETFDFYGKKEILNLLKRSKRRREKFVYRIQANTR